MAMTAVVGVLVVAVAGLAVAGQGGPRWNELEGYTFERYVEDFGKPHARGTAEWDMRGKRFDAALASVRQHNADTRATWKRGINKFSDWTEAEKRMLRGLRGGGMEHATVPPPRQYHVSRNAPLPRSVDYRNRQPAVLTGIKDQGMCGSCWAHAATQSIETYVALVTGKLFVLSQQQVTSCTPNPHDCGGTGGCMGATAELAFEYVSRNRRLAQEWDYPYTSAGGNSTACETAKLTRGQQEPIHITGYTVVRPNDVAAVEDALARVGPLSVSVAAGNWLEYEEGIFEGCLYERNITMDHAVQLVGYGESDDVDYWIIRNSWSPNWGELGYMRLRRHRKNFCGWNVDPQQGNGCKGQSNAPQWVCGMCGVTFEALYPNVDGGGT